MKPDTIQLNTNLASSPRFGRFSVSHLAQAAMGRVIPQPPAYDQFVFNTLAGEEVQVFIPSDMTSGRAGRSDKASKGAKLNVKA